MTGLWQVTLTVLSGVLIYILGQITMKLVIEPILDLRKLRGEIADALFFYANIYFNPQISAPEETQAAGKAFRQQASQLMARSFAIPGYWVWSLFCLVPKQLDVTEASRLLTGLSNGVLEPHDAKSGDDNQKRAKRIKELLKLESAGC